MSDEESQARSGEVWIRKTSTSESLLKRRNVRLSDIKTKDSLNLWDKFTGYLGSG